MKNPRPPPKPESTESSVVVSLQELVRLERARVEDEARTETQRSARAEADRRAGEQRRADDARSRKAAADERARQSELRARMDDAQIEGAKLAELENRKLAQQQRLHLERLAAEQEHERAMAQLRATAHRSFPVGLVVGAFALLAALAIAFVVAFALRRPSPVVEAPSGAADEQRAADQRAADARTARQKQELEDLLHKLQQAQKQPLPSASGSPAAAPPAKPRPPTIKGPSKQEGCTVEIAGVPMCAKK